MSRGSPSGPPSAIARHATRCLGEPFNVMEEEVAPKRSIRVLGFAETPAVGQVTLLTDGIAQISRADGFSGKGGYGQELVFVIGDQFFDEGVLDLFLAMASLYVRERALLLWGTPIRLASAIAGSSGLSYLLPSPAAVFDVGFQLVHEPGKSTQFILMIPVYESEAHHVLTYGESAFYDDLERMDVDISDLRRPPMYG